MKISLKKSLQFITLLLIFLGITLILENFKDSEKPLTIDTIIDKSDFYTDAYFNGESAEIKSNENGEYIYSLKVFNERSRTREVLPDEITIIQQQPIPFKADTCYKIFLAKSETNGYYYIPENTSGVFKCYKKIEVFFSGGELGYMTPTALMPLDRNLQEEMIKNYNNFEYRFYIDKLMEIFTFEDHSHVIY
jgi:hypothetical protein